jgi:hypothetical protein
VNHYLGIDIRRSIKAAIAPPSLSSNPKSTSQLLFTNTGKMARAHDSESINEE